MTETPIEAPQTMAFDIAADDLAAYRDVVRAVEEEADAAPLRALWRSRRPAYERAWDESRCRIESAWLIELCAQATAAARRVRVRAALAPVVRWLRRRATVDVRPDRWLTMADAAGFLAYLDAFLDAGLELSAQARVGVLVDDLMKLRDQAPHAHRAWEPSDVSWVRGLRFGKTLEATPTTGVPGVDDVVLGAPGDRFTGSNPFLVLCHVQELLGLQAMLDTLAEPFAESRGPGPFLPCPPMAEPIDDPGWKRLPFFRVDHWGWPLCHGRFLEGGALEAAARWARDAEPDRAWHETFNYRPVQDDWWEAIVASHWPRLRDRFVDLLLDSARRGRAVVLLDNDLDHPCSPGDRRPERST